MISHIFPLFPFFHRFLKMCFHICFPMDLHAANRRNTKQSRSKAFSEREVFCLHVIQLCHVRLRPCDWVAYKVRFLVCELGTEIHILIFLFVQVIAELTRKKNEVDFYCFDDGLCFIILLLITHKELRKKCRFARVQKEIQNSCLDTTCQVNNR